MADPAPLQPDLPFDLEGPEPPATPPRPAPKSSDPPAEVPASRPAWRPAVVEEPPPPLTQQLLERLRKLPWSRWRALGRRAIGISGGIGAIGARKVRLGGAIGASKVRLGVAVAGSAIQRGAPYAATLARKVAKAGLVRAALRLGGTAVHVAGFPGVVTRTALQFTVVHRAGLTVESVTYFEAGDPAGYLIYQAPPDLTTGVAVTFVPTVILAGLAILCLAPALAPRAVLHLHPTLLTWLQIWLGLAFAAHALPNHEEVAPLAGQARTGVGQAEPLALLTILPTQLIAWITAFGGLAPAAVGMLAILWVSGVVFH